MKAVNWLRKSLRKQDFNPGLLGVFTNPFYIARKGLFISIKSLSHYITGNVLDIGCGRKPYLLLFDYKKYTGLDIENPGHDHTHEAIDIFYDGKKFPFPDEQFDNAICNQVLEHIFEPSEFLTEIKRVLKPDGYLLLTVPFLWDEHEQPNDYARYSSFGLKYLLTSKGFEIIEFKKSVNDIRVIFQLSICYIVKKIDVRNKFLNLIFVFVLASPFNILGEILAFILPKNDDLYLDNIILIKKRR